jgi:hypothetical protein
MKMSKTKSITCLSAVITLKPFFDKTRRPGEIKLVK